MTDRLLPPLESSPTHRNDTLKIIALVTMLIDHIGAIYFPEQLLWRTIGRLAFPIFSWQLVEGFIHTSSRLRYGSRIFLFGCISQAPYMFLNPEIAMYPVHINIMFQLFSGILLLAAVEAAARAMGQVRHKPLPHLILSSFWIAVSLILIVTPDLLNAWNPEFRFSYGTYGQLLFLIFYGFRGSPAGMAMGYLALSIFHALEMSALWEINSSLAGMAGIRGLLGFWTDPEAIRTTALWTLHELPVLGSVYFQARSMVTLPLIWFFENRPGRLKLNRWVGYWFYPVHIALLVSAKWLMMQS